MEPNEIKAELVRRKIKMKTIAIQCDVAATAISMVVSGVRKTLYIQEEISKSIGLPVDQVFPPTPKET